MRRVSWSSSSRSWRTFRSSGCRRSSKNGFSIAVLVSLGIAILPNLPGFLVTVKLIDAASVPHFSVTLYSYAWFVGFAIAFSLYVLFRRLAAREHASGELLERLAMSSPVPRLGTALEVAILMV